MPGLIRYKRMVVLINNQTQSTAELMAAVIKKYNVGVVVGTPSKGWGTIEKVFPLTNKGFFVSSDIAYFKYFPRYLISFFI